MIITITYIILSFFLDGIYSNYVNFTLIDISYFKTIFTIISLIIVNEYYYNKKKYIILLLITSLIFDIVYTNTFILNTVIFFVIYLANIFLDNKLNNNIMTINIRTYISISIYHILTYVILLLSNYNSYNPKLLLNIIIRSLPMTIIYTTICYILLKSLKIKKIK